MAKRHPDVNFEVVDRNGGLRGDFKTFDEAASKALNLAMATGYAAFDVIVWSESGARWLGGDDAVDSYREDPEASIFEHYEIRVNAQGRVA